MRQSTGSALVQVMACRLFGTKPLPEPMLADCQLDAQEQTSVKFESKYKLFIDENAFQNVFCQIGDHFVQGRWVNAAIMGNVIVMQETHLMWYRKVMVGGGWVKGQMEGGRVRLPSHYLNQWWLSSQCICLSPGDTELNHESVQVLIMFFLQRVTYLQQKSASQNIPALSSPDGQKSSLCILAFPVQLLSLALGPHFNVKVLS